MNARPGRAFYGALTAYRETGGEFAEALGTRNRHLQDVTGRGMVQSDCHCRLERCRLLALARQPLAEALAETKAVVQQLKLPQPWMEALRRIERGDAH